VVSSTWKVSGLRDVELNLRRLKKTTSKRLLRKIGIEALEPIAAGMRSRASRRRGDLIEGITVGTRLARSQKRFAGLGGSSFKDPNMMVVYAGPGQHPQAITEEIGTFNQAADPFVAPAWDAGHRGALTYVSTNLGQAVMKSVKRASKKGTLR